MTTSGGMKRFAGLMCLAILTVPGLAGCSNDAPPTSRELATKMKSAGFCTSISAAPKSKDPREAKDRTLGGAWTCVRSKRYSFPAAVWGWRTAGQAQSALTLFRHQARGICDMEIQLGGRKNVARYYKTAIVQGATWGVALPPEDNTRTAHRVSDALGGKVVVAGCV